MGAVSVSHDGLGYHDPRIGMQKNPAVFLGPRRIGGNAAFGRIEPVKTRSAQLDAFRRVEALENRFQGACGTVGRRETRKYRPRLTVDIYFALLVGVRSKGRTVMVKVSYVPLSVPGMLIKRLFHGFIILRTGFNNCRVRQVTRKLDHFEQRFPEQAGGERRFRADFQIHRVVPIGKTQKRQAVFPAVIPGKRQRPLQMFEDLRCFLRFTSQFFFIKRDVFFQKSKIPGFLNVRAYCQHGPQMVVGVIMGKIGALKGIAFVSDHGERIELVQGAAVFFLDRQQFDQKALSPVGRSVHDPHDVL